MTEQTTPTGPRLARLVAGLGAAALVGALWLRVFGYPDASIQAVPPRAIDLGVSAAALVVAVLGYVLAVPRTVLSLKPDAWPETLSIRPSLAAGSWLLLAGAVLCLVAAGWAARSSH